MVGVGRIVACARAMYTHRLSLDINLIKHLQMEHNRAAIVTSEEFRKSMSSQQLTIQQQLNKFVADRIALNCQKLS